MFSLGLLESIRCFPWLDVMTTQPQASSDKLAQGPHSPLPSEGQGPGWGGMPWGRWQKRPPWALSGLASLSLALLIYTLLGE